MVGWRPGIRMLDSTGRSPAMCPIPRVPWQYGVAGAIRVAAGDLAPWPRHTPGDR